MNRFLTGPNENVCPFILQVYGIWSDNAYTYLCSEPCVGGELFNRVVERKRFPEPMAKLYMYQVCV